MIATSACRQTAQSSFFNLVKAAQRGNQRAFGELHDTHRNMVQATVEKIVRNRDDADDVVQEVFLQAMHRISELNSPASFSGWLRTIARRKALDFLKAKNRRKEIVNTDCFAVTPNRELSPVETLIQAERQEQTRRAVDTLPPTERETVTWVYFECHSLRTISERTAVPTGTLKRRAHTARKKLQPLLDRV